MWDIYQKKSDSKNFFKTLGVGDLQVPSVSDFAGESPLNVVIFLSIKGVQLYKLATEKRISKN